MTFMLNYAWRRRAQAEKGRQSPSPLAVQASEDTSAAADRDANDENCIAPPTPEGLRPRKSLQAIREELHIPEHVLLQNHQKNEAAQPSWQPMTCLPPRASPQVTNSSFYSRDSSSGRIAESPDLGQARTAVGALVGMSQGVTSKKTIQDNDAQLGMLPPRSWNEAATPAEDEHVSYQQLHDSMDVWSPAKASSSIRAGGSPQSTVNSSIHPSPSTKAWREWQQQEEHQRNVNVSFSSQAALMSGQEQQEMKEPCYNFDSIAPEESRQDMHDGPSYVVASDANMANVSILSQSSAPINTMSHHHEERDRYATSRHDHDSVHSLDSIQNSNASRSRANSVEEQENAMEIALMQRKMKNQRRAKEQLLMGVVQRLQHNLDLISDVDAMHEEDERWFVKTPMDNEGLLTGFSKATRRGLRKYIRSILDEMQVACPEEFILSPSQILGMADTHDDLHDALVFLDGILQIAVPLSEQNPGDRWTCKPEIRHTMGITSIPESPEAIRAGGDTSVFSLPSDTATPCTSNVSLATTITSKPSPSRGTQARSAPTHEARQIRRSIEIVSTLLQKMSIACHTMANRSSSQDSIRATEEIKRNYLQLTTMKNPDLRCVVEAFIVGAALPHAPLARAVSVEDDQPIVAWEQEEQKPIVTMQLPAQSNPEQPKEMLCVANGKIAATHGSWQNMFSPCTDDMESVPIEPEPVEYEADDLRRTVGSNDYDDKVEERDAAPEDGRQESPESAPLTNMVYYSWGAAELAATPHLRKLQ